MPQIKSAIKRVAIAERNRLRNKSAKSTIKTLMKKFFTQADAYAAGAEDVTLEQVQTSMSAAFSKIDKAAGKGILHRNTAARRKARLARTLKQAETAKAES
ncbi:MAG: 30S ribosomal protein S20 [Cyanobacteria bacterium J06639_1]